MSVQAMIEFGDSRLPERFWSKAEVDRECWSWIGSRNSRGYGNYWHDGRVDKSHRVTFKVLVGPIGEGLELDHLCRVHHCVNPCHLEAVTHHENVLRGEGGKFWADKTHCPHGHEYAGDNLYVHEKTGKRQCKTCKRSRAKTAYRARRELPK